MRSHNDFYPFILGCIIHSIKENLITKGEEMVDWRNEGSK